MENSLKSHLAIGLGLVMAFAFITVIGFQRSQASAIPGLQATVATSSNPAVDTTARILFASSTCAARVVTTYASPVMLTFADRGLAPTATYGHLQAASTTVAYDSGQFGCGQVKVYSFTAQSITVSESN